MITVFQARFPQAWAFHMSGKKDVPSAMHFRREGIPMSIPGLDEWHIQQTDAENIRLAKQAINP